MPINKVIEIARKEIGYLEKKNKNNLYEKTANAGSGNYTKYWVDIYPKYQGSPWCACFVTWVFTQAFGKEKTKELLKHYPFIYCPTLGNLAKLNSNPKVGDIVLFYKNGRFSHTGIVSYVKGDYFKSIEGNTSTSSGIQENGGGVAEKGYYNSSLKGTKFVTPDWSIVSAEIKFNETPLFNTQGKILSNLNIRSKPTTDATIIGKHNPGDIVIISAATDNGWYKVNYPNIGTGYLFQKYVYAFPIEEQLTQEEFSNLFAGWVAERACYPGNEWSQSARDFCENEKIINGDENGNKKYLTYLTREELCVILYNIFGKR